MKFFWFFLILVSSTSTVFAQTITEYRSELEKVDISKVIFEYQEKDKVSCVEYPNIIITNVIYHKPAKKYFVYGFIEDVNYFPKRFNDAVYWLSISKKNGGRFIYITTTTKNGVFAFSLGEDEKARFNTTLYVDLYIKKSE